MAGLGRLRWWAVAIAVLAGAEMAAAPARAQAGGADSGDITLEAMEPQELPPGRCGLFLWSRDAQPALVMVAYANPTEARVRTNGRNRYLRRTAFAKELVYGHFERQTFTDGRLTFDVELTFDTARELRSGAVVKSGVIRSRDGARWEAITPVGGLVACQDPPGQPKR
jgi:hypothetical protein